MSWRGQIEGVGLFHKSSYTDPNRDIKIYTPSSKARMLETKAAMIGAEPIIKPLGSGNQRLAKIRGNVSAVASINRFQPPFPSFKAYVRVFIPVGLYEWSPRTTHLEASDLWFFPDIFLLSNQYLYFISWVMNFGINCVKHKESPIS